jgi:hypothetical protein
VQRWQTNSCVRSAAAARAARGAARLVHGLRARTARQATARGGTTPAAGPRRRAQARVGGGPLHEAIRPPGQPGRRSREGRVGVAVPVNSYGAGGLACRTFTACRMHLEGGAATGRRVGRRPYRRWRKDVKWTRERRVSAASIAAREKPSALGGGGGALLQ